MLIILTDFYYFHQGLQTNARIVPESWSLLLPSTSFPVHYKVGQIRLIFNFAPSDLAILLLDATRQSSHGKSG
jgi:hypothetical protein